MYLQTRKINFVQEFLKLQNEELIVSLKLFLKKGKSSKTVKPMSQDEFNNRIDKSLIDAKAGRLTASDDLISEIEVWK